MLSQLEKGSNRKGATDGIKLLKRLLPLNQFNLALYQALNVLWVYKIRSDSFGKLNEHLVNWCND